MARNDPSEFGNIVQIVLFVILLFFVGFSIANAVYYARSRDTTNPNPPISKNAATTMMVINIIITILAALFAVIIMVALIRKGNQKAMTDDVKYSKDATRDDVTSQVSIERTITTEAKSASSPSSPTSSPVVMLTPPASSPSVAVHHHGSGGITISTSSTTQSSAPTTSSAQSLFA
jgi:heme/copper-type cytochrome/quinol oxidase subunit 2